MEFPRVLVICSIPINAYSGGGIAMGSFFKGWPQDSIAQIYSCPIELDHSVVQKELVINYYGFLNEEIKKDPLCNFNLLSNKLLKRIASRFFLANYFADFSKILTWCQAFSPQVIYTQPCEFPSFYWWLPYRLSQSLKIPLVTHIMDDWPALIEKKYISSPIKSYLLRHELSKLLKISTENLSISDEMSREFKERYSVQFTKFHGSIELNEWLRINKQYENNNATFNITYVGKLHSKLQLQSVIDLAGVVSKLRDKGYNIFLNIYTPYIFDKIARAHLSNLPGVLYGGDVEHVNFPSCLASADILILPVNFDKKSLQFVRLSMPNKVSAYMASGTPVLVYGPPETPPVSYADSCKWGYVVSNRNLEELENAVLKLMSSAELRKELGQRARNLALQDFDADKVRQKFRQLICDVTFHRKDI